jgi:type IV fimbrial biogenesis protein FimT
LFFDTRELAHKLLKSAAEEDVMQNSKGFSLMELMITIAVIAILAAIAIPGYIGWLPKRHLQSSAVDVQVAINVAKATAIRENTDVVLTFNPANDDYLAFIDSGDGAGGSPDGIQNAGEPTIRNRQMSPGIDLSGTNFGDTLIFNSRGLEKNGISGDITLSNTIGGTSEVNVTVTGISRITRYE